MDRQRESSERSGTLIGSDPPVYVSMVVDDRIGMQSHLHFFLPFQGLQALPAPATPRRTEAESLGCNL